MLLIPLMHQSIMDRHAYTYYLFPTITSFLAHKINIKLYGQIDVNMQHQFDANS